MQANLQIWHFPAVSKRSPLNLRGIEQDPTVVLAARTQTSFAEPGCKKPTRIDLCFASGRPVRTLHTLLVHHED